MHFFANIFRANSGFVRLKKLLISGGILLSLSFPSFGQYSTFDKSNRVSDRDRKLNIIFIFSDDHAYQAISAYGSQLVETPNIDRIAQNGVVFNNQLITNSICGPSRATLLTGKYSHKNGFRGNGDRFDITQPVFSRLMQKGGYETAWIGKWHLGNLPNDTFDHWYVLPGQGYYYNPEFINDNDDTIRHEGYVTNIITEQTKSFLENRNKDKPFFLVIGEKATHRQWLPDIQDLGAYDSIDFPIPETFYDQYEGRIAAEDQDMTINKTLLLQADLKVHLDYNHNQYNRFTPEQEKAFRAYYDIVTVDFDKRKLTGNDLVEWKFQRYLRDYLATARSLDRNIGEILDYLEEEDLSKNTVIIYGSDQGFYLGEHGWFDKRFMYEESLRTPFIMQHPYLSKARRTIDELVLNIDWAPTFLDIAGISIPDDMQGESFLPLLLEDRKASWRKAAYYHYYEFPQAHHVYPHFGIRTDRYKLVRFYGGKDFWELFDLQQDPRELENRYNNTGYTKIVDELKEKLTELVQQYDDQEALKILNTDRQTFHLSK